MYRFRITMTNGHSFIVEHKESSLEHFYNMSIRGKDLIVLRHLVEGSVNEPRLEQVMLNKFNISHIQRD